MALFSLFHPLRFKLDSGLLLFGTYIHVRLLFSMLGLSSRIPQFIKMFLNRNPPTLFFASERNRSSGLSKIIAMFVTYNAHIRRSIFLND